MNGEIDVSLITLTTKRLILRPWKISDLEDFFEYARVDGVGQMAGWIPHSNIEESQKVLKEFIRGKKTLALVYKEKVIGSLGIEEYHEEQYAELQKLRGRELGYVLSKEYWGKGFMPEAVKAVLTYLFDTVGLDFVLAAHFKQNNQSRRVIEKCGFHYIKTCPYRTQYQTTETSVEYIKYNPKYGKEINDVDS